MSTHSLAGRFPSVSLFKEYHNADMAILEQSDYTMISGSPFIKKSDGWGSCERCEKRFRKRNHDIPSTAETRAKNKACQNVPVRVQEEWDWNLEVCKTGEPVAGPFTDMQVEVDS